MKTNRKATYTCEYCNSSYRKKQQAEECEMRCKERQETRLAFENQVFKLGEDEGFIHVLSVEQMELFDMHCFGGNIISYYEYEEFKYPGCFYYEECEDEDNYDDYTWTVIDITSAENKIKEIEEKLSKIKKFVSEHK